MEWSICIIKNLTIFVILFFYNINCHVFIAGPESLRKIFKEKNGRDELYSNFANYGKIPYGYTTVRISVKI